MPEHTIAVEPGILVSAVRYALGRQTYVVSETVDAVVQAWPALPVGLRQVIRRDVLRELTDHQGGGADMDRDQWRRVLELGVVDA